MLLSQCCNTNYQIAKLKRTSSGHPAFMGVICKENVCVCVGGGGGGGVQLGYKNI